MKKKITAAALLVLLFAMLALGTAANPTAEGRATNVVTTSAISMSVRENHAGNAATATDTETGSYVLPGTLMPSQSVQQKATVRNGGSEPFYTRVKVDVTVKDSSGATLPGVDSYVILKDTHVNWIKQEEDDWYYYNAAVGGGTETEPIFTELGLDQNAPNSMMGATVTVTVKAQAVQSKNNPIPDGGNVTNVTGWPAEN